MNKKIKLFEMFAGLGSQYKSLKNIYKNSNKDVISVGVCEFYIDAIISYMIIHYGLLEPENKLTKNQMVDILSNYTFSSNSKDVVNSNYFNRFNELKLRSYFSYLYAYLKNNYFNDRYNKRERITRILKELSNYQKILTY
ncbi:DNA (cytosine-5-)-methyltransferase N-terminal subunit [Mycoplasmopsis bovigenitalium]|nr:DNA methyltransferase [Mycoplasmopsis bovigenitalium]